MSNFICPHCQQVIDDGSDGFTSDREIELEKKLDIAIKALEEVNLFKLSEEKFPFRGFYLTKIALLPSLSA